MKREKRRKDTEAQGLTIRKYTRRLTPAAGESLSTAQPSHHVATHLDAAEPGANRAGPTTSSSLSLHSSEGSTTAEQSVTFEEDWLENLLSTEIQQDLFDDVPLS